MSTPTTDLDVSGEIGILAEHLTPAAADMPDDAIAMVADEITDPATIGEHVDVGGIAFPVKMLRWKYERHWTRILAPMLRFLLEAAAVGSFEEALTALLSESDADLGRMVALTLAPQADLITDLPPADPDDKRPSLEVLVSRIEEWLGDNSQMEELVIVVIAQIRKNKVSDTLGKLWGPGVLSVKALRGLSTLSNLPGLANTAP